MFSEGSTPATIAKQFQNLYKLLNGCKEINLVIVGPNLQTDIVFDNSDLPNGINSIKCYKSFYHEYFAKVLLKNIVLIIESSKLYFSCCLSSRNMGIQHMER